VASPPILSHFISVHGRAGLDRDAAGVEGDGLADDRDGRLAFSGAAISRTMSRADGPALANGENSSEAVAPEMVFVPDLGRQGARPSRFTALFRRGSPA